MSISLLVVTILMEHEQAWHWRTEGTEGKEINWKKGPGLGVYLTPEGGN